MLPKKIRLTKRGSFAYVYRAGESYSTSIIKVFCARSASLKIGFSVSNKIGKAVKRNKVKRQMRAAVRTHTARIERNCQIIFAAKETVRNAGWKEISRDIAYLIGKINGKRA